MPRTRRYIFNMLTVVSLLLMVATVGLWVDSHFNDTEVEMGKVQGDSNWVVLQISDGVIAAISHEDDDRISESWDSGIWRGRFWAVSKSYLFDSYWSGFGFTQQLMNEQVLGVSVPLWSLALIFAILPAIWLIKWRWQRTLGPPLGQNVSEVGCRIWRYTFNALVVLSLLLILGSATLWVRSYWIKEEVCRSEAYRNSRGTAIRRAFSGWGSVAYTYMHIKGSGIRFDRQPPKPPEWYYQRDQVRDPLFAFSDPPTTWNRFGFAHARGSHQFANYDIVIIPHWLLVVIFFILPTFWLYKWNKRRKLGPNSCSGCGYDLRGNTSGKCPECGATAATKSEPA